MRYVVLLLMLVAGNFSLAQSSPYADLPPVEEPYYRVRYEASTQPGELIFPVSYTLWVPPGIETLRGIVVHQHGCGEGSCKSGQTAAFDLHWQALAKKHACALLGPVYEQPQEADCQMWCDPRNGSDAAFQTALAELAELSRHPELTRVPWALWGHSGGGHWAGGMLLLHPERVAAAWLRSGVPMVTQVEGKPEPYAISSAACAVPIMCNLGTQEGVTVRDGRFSGVWPGVETFFRELRTRGGLIGVAVDPLTSHECGNQRYLAIPWLDACLEMRLPAGRDAVQAPLRSMPVSQAWIAPLEPDGAKPAMAIPLADFLGNPATMMWLPNADMAQAWEQYRTDTEVRDTSPPPAPTHLTVEGNQLTWQAEADLESGLASFIIERDGQHLANFPEEGENRFGRPIFQNLQYSDTPTQPLARMQFVDRTAAEGASHRYRVISVNTVGLRSTAAIARGER